MAPPQQTMPGADRDDETGQYTDSYPDEAFFTAIREHDGLPTTPSVADTVGCNRRTAHYRLTQLEEEGKVASQQAGRTLVWSVVDNEE